MKTFSQPLAYQVEARFGLSARARPMNRCPASKSWTTDQRVSGARQDDGVVASELQRGTGEAGGFRDLGIAVRHPAVRLPHRIAPRRHRVRGREGRVALDRTVEQAQRFVVSLARALIEVLETAQIVIVGVEAVGALALGALDLGLLQPRRDCTDDAGGDEVLQIEDVVEIAVEAIGPQVAAL